jgi:hypothetical protein
VHAVGAAGQRGAQHAVRIEVTGPRRRTAEGDGLIGRPDVHRVPVGRGVDGHAGQAGRPAGPDDPDRDLAPVGDQDLSHKVPLTGPGDFFLCRTVRIRAARNR